MAEYRQAWIPKLEEKALSRKHVLNIIDEIRRPKNQGGGSATIQRASAIDWLQDIDEADLLLTDPPYSTEIDDIHKFVKSWLPLAISKLKPTGRGLVFIGAYADEFAAYFSQKLPVGWQWAVPHAWVYRNTIGPTPEMDFIRNWQCILSIRGPKAGSLHTDKINELLAGFVENAPDGRQGVRHHKWEKPIELMQRLIKICTDPSDITIDPFAGSGTTLLAAKLEGRIGRGCDNNLEAIKIAEGRGCNVQR